MKLDTTYNHNRTIIQVHIRVLSIGRLKIHGRSHAVRPLEITPNQLVFLCPWDIPENDQLGLGYELDDEYDHLLIPGSSLSLKPWGEQKMYTAKLQSSELDKLRITGMLNRMLLSCMGGESAYTADNPRTRQDHNRWNTVIQ